MTRVEWTRQSGDDVEAMIALFISAEHPNAVRITPSRGDAGIDVLVPGVAGARVYQVKRFTEHLTSSRKKQIVKSVQALAGDPRVSGDRVAEWHLVMPRDPTLEDRAWLSPIVTGLGLPEPTWDGLSRCDLWASVHPEVVDYYIHGGQDRVREAAGQLIALAALKGLSADEAAKLQPAGVAGVLSSAVQYLNDQDPFYRYSLAVSPGPVPALPSLVEVDGPYADPGAVLVNYWGNQNAHVKVAVVPKSSVALELSPIGGSMTFTAKAGTAEAKALADFHRYGSPLNEINASAVVVNAPGGLGGSFESGQVSVGPARSTGSESTDVRLVVMGPDREEVATVVATRVYSTHGQPHNGKVIGAETLFETGGCTVRFRVDIENQMVGVQYSTGDIVGRLAVDMLPILRFFAALRPPNSLAVAERYGPLPTTGLFPLPGSPPDDLEVFLTAVECLAAIQEFTNVPLQVPNLCRMNGEDLDALWHASVLAQGGELRGTAQWIEVAHAGEEALARARFVRLTPWVFEVEDEVLDLGFVTDSWEGRQSDGASGVRSIVWEVVDEIVTRRTATPREVEQLPRDGSWVALPLDSCEAT